MLPLSKQVCFDERESPVKRVAVLIAALALAACVSDFETAEPAPPPAPAPAKSRAPAPFPEPGDIAQGRAFAQANCSRCHAIGPTGESPYAPAPPFRTLHKKYDVERLAEAFAEGILVGHKGQKQMPEFVMTTDEIDNLLAYLKSLK
jgi:mono/diheme cytochrome c family protein